MALKLTIAVQQRDIASSLMYAATRRYQSIQRDRSYMVPTPPFRNAEGGSDIVSDYFAAFAWAVADQLHELVQFGALSVGMPNEHEQLAADLRAVDLATLERLALAIGIEIDRRKAGT